MEDGLKEMAASTDTELPSISAATHSPGTPLSTSPQLSTRCCSVDRLTSEWRLGPYQVTDWNGRTIDLRRSFGAGPFQWTATYRAAVAIWVIATCLYDLATLPVDLDANRMVWFAYYTHWSILPSILYFIFAIWASRDVNNNNNNNNNNIIIIDDIDSDNHKTQSGNVVDKTVETSTVHHGRAPYSSSLSTGRPLLEPSLPVRVTWSLHSISVAMQIPSCILFWWLVFDPNEDTVVYVDLVKHLLLAILLVLDGQVLNRIPVRLKQFLPLVVFNAVYSVFLLVYSYADLGSPIDQDQDPATDDDALYIIFNWQRRPLEAILWTIVSNVVIFPAFSWLAWLLSATGGGCCRFDGTNRRYVPVGNDHDEGNGNGNVVTNDGEEEEDEDEDAANGNVNGDNDIPAHVQEQQDDKKDTDEEIGRVA